MLTALISVILICALALSLRWNWWRPKRKGIPVLMYHKIGQAPKDSRQKPLWVDDDRFEWQMRTLKEKGYQSVTFADIQSGRIPDKAVMITFDDGYLNQKTNAAPIMARYGMRGIFYIVADAIGTDNFWHNPQEESRQAMMKDSDIKSLLDAGHEIGSHTLTHRRMDTLHAQEAKTELSLSKERLESLFGIQLLSFAFPYGKGEDVDGLVRASLEVGYKWVLGIHAGIWNGNNGGRPLPRVYVRGDDTKIDFCLQLTRGKSRL